VTVTAKTRAASTAMADGLAAQQRRYAGMDATIRPESFRAPTVDSLRAPAERAGIDLDRWLARQ
jgi:hypothetical protein